MQEATLWLARARAQEAIDQAAQDRLARAARRTGPRRSLIERISRHR